jgi:hypothetical protein
LSYSEQICSIGDLEAAGTDEHLFVNLLRNVTGRDARITGE